MNECSSRVETCFIRSSLFTSECTVSQLDPAIFKSLKQKKNSHAHPVRGVTQISGHLHCQSSESIFSRSLLKCLCCSVSLYPKGVIMDSTQAYLARSQFYSSSLKNPNIFPPRFVRLNVVLSITMACCKPQIPRVIDFSISF